MEQEILNLEQVASILHCDVREVTKMASRGQLPGQKVAGQWRFASAEVSYWIERNIPDFSAQQLTDLETGAGQGVLDPRALVCSLLSEATIAVPLQAGTRGSVLRELVKLAENSWHVYDPEALLEAVQLREDMANTAFACGVAFPHPRRPQPGILGDSVIAYGRTSRPVPFGGSEGTCDLFFLVCCRDYATHLKVLARLSRMMLRAGVIEDLRSAETVADAYQILKQAEIDMMAEAQ